MVRAESVRNLCVAKGQGDEEAGKKNAILDVQNASPGCPHPRWRLFLLAVDRRRLAREERRRLADAVARRRHPVVYDTDTSPRRETSEELNSKDTTREGRTSEGEAKIGRDIVVLKIHELANPCGTD
jgi:hypothetical protein